MVEYAAPLDGAPLAVSFADLRTSTCIFVGRLLGGPFAARSVDDLLAVSGASRPCLAIQLHPAFVELLLMWLLAMFQYIVHEQPTQLMRSALVARKALVGDVGGACRGWGQASPRVSSQCRYLLPGFHPLLGRRFVSPPGHV